MLRMGELCKKDGEGGHCDCYEERGGVCCWCGQESVHFCADNDSVEEDDGKQEES